MKTQLPRENNLPIDLDYKLIDVYEAEEISTSCDNCDRPIRNIATLLASNNKQYFVGLDCAEHLTMQAGSQWEAQRALRVAKKEMRELKNLKKQAKNNNLYFSYNEQYNIYYPIQGVQSKKELRKFEDNSKIIEKEVNIIISPVKYLPYISGEPKTKANEQKLAVLKSLSKKRQFENRYIAYKKAVADMIEKINNKELYHW